MRMTWLLSAVTRRPSRTEHLLFGPCIPVGIAASLFMLLTVACSSSTSSKDITTPTIAPVEDTLDCPAKRAGEGLPPEELALIFACNAADADALTLRNFKVEKVTGSDLRAEYVVQADDLSCGDSCPKAMEYKVKLFVNTSGTWSSEEASGWAETKESVQERDRAHAEAVFGSATYMVKDTTAEIVGYDLYTLDVEAELIPKDEAIRVWLQIEFEDGRTAVVSSPNGIRFQFDSVPPEDASLNTLSEDAEDLTGQVVTVKQYRLGVAYGLNEASTDFEYIKTDWTAIQ